MYENIQEII